MKIFLPFHIPKLVKSLPFYIPEAWKRYPFRAEPPCIGHCGEYPPPPGHGVSIQISINLEKKFLRISRIRKICCDQNFGVFAYFSSFISQILEFIYRPVVIFILIYFELRDTENQQLLHRMLLPYYTYDYTLSNLHINMLTTSIWISIKCLKCLFFNSRLHSIYILGTDRSRQ